MRVMIAALLLGSCAVAGAHYNSEECHPYYAGAGLSVAWNETIAHAMHSMTVQHLRMFNPAATVQNSIPTVDRNSKTIPWELLPSAPDMPVKENAFATPAMNLIDHILSGMGHGHDGLGIYTNGVERIVHEFHMRDLYERVLKIYQTLPEPLAALCDCLSDTASNGINEAMKVYKFVIFEHGIHTGTFPRLVDTASWVEGKKVWAPWYEKSALYDVAVYLKCATAGTDINVLSKSGRAEQGSCKTYGCDPSYWDPSRSCQCNAQCDQYQNCCPDYQQTCADQPSCRKFGCDPGHWDPSRSCQCNEACSDYDNCCADYWSRCNDALEKPDAPLQLV